MNALLTESDRDRIASITRSVRDHWNDRVQPVWLALLANPAHANLTSAELVSLAIRHAVEFDSRRLDSIERVRAEATDEIRRRRAA